MATCSSCDVDLPIEAKFCLKCGTPAAVEKSCPTCQTVNRSGASFCANCGQALGEDPRPQTASQSGGELYVRRISADEVDHATFRSSLVIRPGSFGVVLRDNLVIDQLPAGRQTVDSVLDRLKSIFSADRQKQVMIVDERPVILSLETTASNQMLRVFLNAERNPDALAVFVSRMLADKSQLTTFDIERAVKKFLIENFSRARIDDGTDPELHGNIRAALRSQFGLATEFDVDRGIPRTTFDLTMGGVENVERICSNESCEKPILAGVKFCGHCGQEQTGTWLAAGLATKDGTPIIVDVSVVVEAEDPPAEFSLSDAVEKTVGRLLRDYDYAQIGQTQLAKISSGLQGALSQQLDVSDFGRITSAAVLDVKTVEGDWKLRTRAALTDAQQELEASRAMTGVEREKVDVQEMAKRVALHRQKMIYDVEFDQDQQALDDRTRRQSLEGTHADLDVAQAKRASDRDLAIDEAERNRERVQAARDREDKSVAKASAREEELEDLAHEMSLENRTQEHDLGMQARSAQADAAKAEAVSAQKRRDVDDITYSAKAEQDLEFGAAEREQNLKLDKFRAMDEIAAQGDAREEASRKAREDHDLAKAELQRQFESDKRQQLAGLTTEQILAMQAGELAAKGQDISAITNSISGINGEKEKAEIKEQLLREMLERTDTARAQEVAREQDSRQDFKDLARDAIGASGPNDSAVDQANRAAAQAVSMSERSMDAMAKVAGAASVAAGKAINPGESTKKSSKKKNCENEECDAKVDADAAFCGECGHPQSA